MEFDEKYHNAMHKYLSRKDRTEYPAGAFDKQGRWIADPSELKDCCKNVKTPSKKHKFVVLNHCTGIEHVANLCGVDYMKLRSLIYLHAKGTKRLTGIQK